MKKTDKNLAIICDIDGTLAILGSRNPYDPTSGNDLLNHPIANIIEVYDKQNVYEISLILISGREEKYRKYTVKWLKNNSIANYKELYLRRNNDRRKDYIIKKEIYNKNIKDHYEVLFVLEDRDQVVKMWRELGLTCLQVEYGNF